MTQNSSIKLHDSIKDVGRPSKFTPDRRTAIIDAISHRIPYEYAAEANGICEETLYEWLRIAKQHRKDGIDSEYTEFSEAIKRAEMTRMREHSDMIAAKPERWQADAWLLERRWYKHYGPNAQLNELNHKLSRLVDGEPNESKRNEENGKEG
jgi:transposase-like protein